MHHFSHFSLPCEGWLELTPPPKYNPQLHVWVEFQDLRGIYICGDQTFLGGQCKLWWPSILVKYQSEMEDFWWKIVISAQNFLLFPE